MQKLMVLKRKENNSYRVTDIQKQKIGDSNRVPVIAVNENNKMVNGLIWKRKEDYVQ